MGFCQKKTDKPNSKKGIKTETIFKYEFEEKFGEFKEIFREKTISKYDSNGNGVEELYNKKDGRSSKVIYKNEYDTKNRRIEVRMYPKIFGGFKTPSMKTTYEYEEY